MKMAVTLEVRMEQRLIAEMAKLRGGKTRLKEIKSEYVEHIERLMARLDEYRSVIQQIDILTANLEDPVDSGAE